MKLNTLLGHLNYEKFIGNENAEVERADRYDCEEKTDNMIFWFKTEFKEKVNLVNKGTIILTAEALPSKVNDNCNYIICENPRREFQKSLDILYPDEVKEFISKSATVAETSTVGKNTFIGHNVVIEDNVRIGEHVIIDSNTVIKANTTIEDHCKIGSNCTIGGVGFGYEQDDEGKFQLIKHVGGVKIEDHVEVGNSVCIDRGVLGNTLIKHNAKIDNLVHIAHGVIIGENSMIIANAMVAGSVVVGKDCWVAPSSSILNGRELKDKSFLGLGAVVVKDVEEGQVVVGNPAKPLKKK